MAVTEATRTTATTRTNARTVLLYGLIGGIIAIYWPAVGMYERFEARGVVEGLIDLGDVLLAITALATGYMAARASSRREADDVAEGGPNPIVAGAAAALLAGLMLALLLLFVDWFGVASVRRMFTSFTPNLINNLLTFGMETITAGAIIIVAGFLVLGTIGAALQQAPQRIRRPILLGLAAVLLASLAEPIIREIFRGLDRVLGLSIPFRWLIAPAGLALPGAMVVFVLAVLVDSWRRRRAQVLPEVRRERQRARAEAHIGPFAQATVIRVVLILLLLVVLAVLPQILGQFLSEVLGTIGVFVLMGLGLNIVVGYAGLLDLGYVAFFAVGAYSTAVLTSPRSFLGEGVGGEALMSFWAALPFILILTMISGLMVGAPVLRLRGDYLAIVTLGFGEIARVVILSDWLRDYLGGAQGILGIPAPPLTFATVMAATGLVAGVFALILGFLGWRSTTRGEPGRNSLTAAAVLGVVAVVALLMRYVILDPTGGEINLRRPENLYYAILLCCLLAAFVAYRLKDSRVGRAWAAMREDESVAEAMGISVINYKLLAFVMGAAVSSFAGAFFAVKLGSVYAHSFDILVSINVLSIVVLGGMGSIPGVVVGALGLVGLPELLREFGEFRLLIYGAILVALMLLKPEGLLPEVRRKRELHERQLEKEQYEERIGEGGTEPLVEPGPEEA